MKNHALHTGLADEGTVIYLDDLGVGLEPMLGMKTKELGVELFMDSANIDVLCITEHWLRNGQFLFGFSSHQIASCFSRENSSHSGSLIVIRNNLNFKERTDIVYLSAERVMEIACVELERLIVMSVYRFRPGDLSKAFNYVNHETLIRKLHHYGVTDRELDLLASHLTNSVQKGDINNMRSSGSVVRMGMP
ncbi:hypothetical protein EVAR_12702_1 [Eumeta japonica]|uniref:Uncharacterized protein n=1 Tax=Eumeta variegata TaxID=151549 RepID=A0A4C1UMJ6_EUMVA|nr:hypothetical protein EVAR_12702_1 [Eumeta japonica]